MNKEFLGGLIGTSLSVVGAATQVNDVLQTISICITILGGIISLVIVPLLSWYKNAKKDGKIDVSEITEAAKIIDEGAKQIKSQVSNEDKREEIKKKGGMNQ